MPSHPITLGGANPQTAPSLTDHARSLTDHDRNQGPSARGHALNTPDHVRTYAGVNAGLVSKINRLRSKLERYAHQAITGDPDGDASPRKIKLYQTVRTGRLDKIKIMHLVDMEDEGTPEHPFKTLKSKGDLSTALLSRAIAELISVIANTTPDDAATAIPFLNKLTSEITKWKGWGVSWDELGKYWAATMRRVTKHSRYFLTGTSDRSSAQYEISWLTQRTTERIALEEAQLSGRREGKKKMDNSPVKPRPKKPRGDEEEDKEKDKDKDKNKVRHAPGIKKGKAQSVPGKGDKAWDDFNEKHPKAAREKDGAEYPACWDYWHGQGCKRGDKCSFHHRS